MTKTPYSSTTYHPETDIFKECDKKASTRFAQVASALHMVCRVWKKFYSFHNNWFLLKLNNEITKVTYVVQIYLLQQG